MSSLCGCLTTPTSALGRAMACLVGFAAVGCGGDGGANWRELRLTGAGVRVEMPGEWQLVPAGDQETPTYRTMVDGTEFIAKEVVLPPKQLTKADRRVILRQSRDGMFKRGGEATAEREIELQGHPGLDVESVHPGSAEGHFQMFLIENKLVILAVSHRRRAEPKARTARFFGSLALLPGTAPAADTALARETAATPARATGDARPVPRTDAETPGLFADLGNELEAAARTLADAPGGSPASRTAPAPTARPTLRPTARPTLRPTARPAATSRPAATPSAGFGNGTIEYGFPEPEATSAPAPSKTAPAMTAPTKPAPAEPVATASAAPAVPVKPAIPKKPAASPTPPVRETPPREDTRTLWKYEDAPAVFSDQKGDSGSFEQAGTHWLEVINGRPASRFTEAARTPEFVELVKQRNGFRVRLYAGRSEYRFASGGPWSSMYPGTWATPAF